MASFQCSSSTIRQLGMIIFLFLVETSSANPLSVTFYEKTCPFALPIIKSGVTAAVSTETRIGASLLRLHFHDCFVNGCDGSVLLDGDDGEKSAFGNANSLRGFEVIDSIKSQLESSCPGVVSCADILAVAARDSVVALGGPTWTVPLGRRDSATASASDANANLPSASSNLTGLISSFSSKGFSVKELVALSGSHTIGKAQCANFRDRIYYETNIDSSFAASLRVDCPKKGDGGDNNLGNLDVTAPNNFDNAYFKNLMEYKGLLHSDQVLFSGGYTDNQVKVYSSNPSEFRKDFANAMVKMGKLSQLTGTNGQIRTDCRKPN